MKRIFIFILALFLTSSTFAQSVSFGPRIGMNVAKLKGEDYSKLGLNFGVFANAYVTQKLGFEVAAMFSQEGASGNSIYESSSLNLSSCKTKLNYLNIPVLLKYRIIGKFNVFAGPQFGVLLNAKQKYDKNTLNLKNSLKDASVAGVVGVGCTFLNLLDVNLNYNFGFNNIVDDKTINPMESFASNFKGGTWQITFGLVF